MNYLVFLLLFFYSTGLLFSSDTLTLEYCREKAMEKSPLAKQKLYYQTKSKIEQESLDANYLPRLNLDGRATYQSDVAKLDFPFPGASSPDIPKDQYSINLNIEQMIWDGGITSGNQDVVSHENKTKEAGVEVSMFGIRSIINGLYLRILLVNQSLKILDVGKNQLDSNRKIIDSYVRNGVMYRSNLESINIEILRIDQKIEELESERMSLIEMLSKWIEEPINPGTELIVPKIQYEEYTEIKRPEYTLFSSKKELLDANSNLVSTKLIPRIFAFASGGYGIPNKFNFFETEGSFYLIAGLNFQWTPFDWSATSKKKQSIEISKSIVDTEHRNFDKNLNISLVKDETEIEKLVDIIKMDEEIISRQERIVDEYFARLQNGTITVTDYLIQVNELIKANVNLDLHKLQKLAAEINIMTQTGNF